MKRLLVPICLWLSVSTAHAAIARVGTANCAGNNSSGATTTAQDGSAANLYKAGISYASGTSPTVTVSTGDTVSAGTARAGVFATARIYTVENATPSATITGTVNGTAIFSSICLYAYSGAASSSVVDQINGNTAGAGTSVTTGSVTPGQNSELIFSVLAIEASISNIAIDSGLTTPAFLNYSGGNYEGVAASDLVQTTATAVNASWSWTSTVGAAASIDTNKVSQASTCKGRMGALGVGC